MPLYPPPQAAGVGTTGLGNFAQSAYISTTVDVTTASTTFVDMLVISLTTFGGKLVCLANVSSSNSSANVGNYFRITVDGTSYGATAQRYTNVPAITGAVIIETPALAAGVHSVNLQWRCSAGTAQCRPVTQPDVEFGSLLVIEVNA